MESNNDISDNNSREIILSNYNDIVEQLYDKYKNDEYMRHRFHYHMTSLLSTTLENESKNHEKRLIRTDNLTNEHQQFIQIFLSENQYYFLPNNNCFYYYDGKNYSQIKEDIIHHQLLMTISKDKKLIEWKYRTKTSVIKQIKERHLFKSIPESDTIQNVLALLHPSIFADKNQAKYFLTILGDNILKKNNDFVFLIKPKAKKLLAEIDSIAYIYTAFTNITSNFVTKYHENYDYKNCRLLKMRSSLGVDVWRNMLTENILDIVCVAAHYSQRFGNAENFIQNVSNDDVLKSYTLFLTNNTTSSIVDTFCDHCIQSYDVDISTVDTKLKSKLTISWKNMHYIWKLFISKLSLPSAIYLTVLKTVLKERFQYDETTDTFYGVTSKYLPCVSDFIYFWENNIYSASQDNEFELDELCVLFKKWTSENSTVSLSNGTISETDVLKILNHFFPSIEIFDKKYILGISCSMWDKNTDIYNALVTLKETYHTKSILEDNHALIAFDEAYDFYFQKNKPISKYIASKKYFEKYLYSNLSHYIVYEKFISSSWYL
jgi:hypothetical protein